MGSKLGTLSDQQTHSRSAVPAVDGGGVNGIILEGSSSRRRHSQSRRSASNAQSGSLNVLGNPQRQRAASTSDALNQPSDGQNIAVGSSNAGHGSDMTNRQHRAAGSQQQYSLFGHYWDAFLNSDTSSEEDEGEESDDDSSGSERRRGGRHRRHHRSQNNSSSFFTSASSTSAASAANAGALPFRIPASSVSSSTALSRASNRRRLRALIAAHSLPFPLFSVSDFKCPVCHKAVPSEDIELHVVVCLTKPRIDYNVDVLAEDKEECIICFEEMHGGDTIARLPCLCIYHKRCIDQWFSVRRACPAHPPDED